MEPVPAKPTRRRFPKWLPQAFGYTLSIACLAWVLHDYPLSELPGKVTEWDWRWIALAVVLDLTVYVVHGWRWKILLAPVARLPFWRTVQSIYIGLFANEILPLRPGEVIRCYLLAHWNNLRLSLALASAGIERLIDGFWMVVVFAILASFVTLKPILVDMAQIIAGLLVVAAVILGYLIVHKQHAHSIARESRWASTLRHLLDGLHSMGSWRTFSRTTLISLLYLVTQIFSVWALMRAAHFDLSVFVAAGVLIVVRFGTVIPSAPGNLGLYQLSTIEALKVFEVETTDAKDFSMVMFVALTLPLLLGGAVAVALSGLNLREIRHRAQAGVEAKTP